MARIDDENTPKQGRKSALTPRTRGNEDPSSNDARDELERLAATATLARVYHMPPPVPEDGWRTSLRQTKHGVTKDPANAALILTNDPAWQGLKFDRFTGREVASRLPNIPGMPEVTTPDGLELHAAQWLALEYGQTFPLESVRGAIAAAARTRPYHQVWSYLAGLEWDGQKRISGWLATYLGAQDSPTVQAIGRMWLISAVARAHKPGAKVDHMLVLEGDQGARKTTALEALCGEAWFQPELGDLRNKDSVVTLQGRWIVCMDELHALRSVDVIELAKNYLTRTVDKYRPPYGRHTVEQPRSCVFAGTTNADSYLSDPTGNRRFWPVKVGQTHKVDLDAIRADRAQLWAEAKEAYRSGEQWWPTKELQDSLTELTEERTHGDTWLPIIQNDIRGREFTTVGLCLDAVGVKLADQKHGEQIRVAKLLTKLGWERYRAREGEARHWRYRPKEAAPVT
jgi:putative DNA primase/helicase